MEGTFVIHSIEKITVGLREDVLEHVAWEIDLHEILEVEEGLLWVDDEGEAKDDILLVFWTDDVHLNLFRNGHE